MYYEVVNVKGNSVRLRYGTIVFDVKVIKDASSDKKQIIKPRDIYFMSSDFSVIVGLALTAYEGNQVVEQENLNHETTERV